MGAGASSRSTTRGVFALASLPEQVDKETAKNWAGDKFDEAAFDQAAKDGTVTKSELVKFTIPLRSQLSFTKWMRSATNLGSSRQMLQAQQTPAPQQEQGFRKPYPICEVQN